ncbi:hypothetical protein NHX12_005975 [Muraenolepis orangiensis]|uniref:Uncharacterized protein n=1 Tax=Muraenolepis orangiensis TaxID=630683 RepID=A0A9Q0DTW5_9TELE|nr:hypothetical protein NHX12_005975 [Muraenolepis orangiensis]
MQRASAPGRHGRGPTRPSNTPLQHAPPTRPSNTPPNIPPRIVCPGKHERGGERGPTPIPAFLTLRNRQLCSPLIILKEHEGSRGTSTQEESSLRFVSVSQT